MMTNILCIILGIVLGGSITALILLRVHKKIDQTALENLQVAEKVLQDNIFSLEQQKELIELEINNLNTTAKQEIQEYKERRYREIDNWAKMTRTTLEGEKEQWKREYEIEYLSTLEDYASEFSKKIQSKKAELAQITQELTRLKDLTYCAIEANKREAEKLQKKDFYKLNLSDSDLEEIKKLRQVALVLRDKEPLNKVIWKVYYEKPTTDLIGRVIGPGVHTGIYKITNLQNQMCYVGQAANLADRWKQHIKRGLGAETPTKNKLYPIMQSIGVENFSFEVIEECDRSKLNEREDYWQEYFHAIDFGYSIK